MFLPTAGWINNYKEALGIVFLPTPGWMFNVELPQINLNLTGTCSCLLIWQCGLIESNLAGGWLLDYMCNLVACCVLQ